MTLEINLHQEPVELNDELVFERGQIIEQKCADNPADCLESTIF